MKKSISKKILPIIIGFLLSTNISAQIYDFYDECYDSTITDYTNSFFFDSREGYNFPTKGTYRMLVVFVNIIYDVTPNADSAVVSNNNWAWIPDTIGGINKNPPVEYFNDVWDNEDTSSYNGIYTRFMSECSFDSLVIIGDFTSVGIKQSYIEPTGESFDHNMLLSKTLDFINTNGLQAYYGHNLIQDYDYATISFLPTRTPNNKVDFVAFFVLNPTSEYGGLKIKPGSGDTYYGTTNQIKIDSTLYSIDAYTMCGIGSTRLKDNCALMVHEFAHGLMGDNSFHTSGGNHLGTSFISTFIYLQQGYGLFNSVFSFRSCNSYERWRLGWQHPDNALYSIASNGVNSEINSQFSGSQSFYLRDFVKYGDAIRIKLPYKDSDEASNQYIWLENHQFGKNGMLDRFVFYNDECIPMGTPGIYSYIQVGKDILSSNNNSLVFPDNETDNLRMLSAEGNFNMTYVKDSADCMNWGRRPIFEFSSANPLSGNNIFNEAIITSDSILEYFDDFKYVGNKLKNDTLYTNFIWLGDTLAAFTDGTKMDISSNPPPINAYTYYSKHYNPHKFTKLDNYRDTRHKYLTGLRIDMNYAYTLSDSTDVFRVDIRWDDYDVKQNVSWAGNIILKEKLNLLSGKTITFEQNHTVYQTYIDSISGEFAPPTFFTCKDNSFFNQYDSSHVIVADKSTLFLESGSHYIISKGADLTVRSGSTLEVEDCALLQIDGKLIVENGANIIIHEGAIVKMSSLDKIDYQGDINQLIYPYIWFDANIISDTTINQNIICSNDITINQGVTLTITSTVQMAPDCRIIVNPGAKLVVDGGKLSNSNLCPGKLWYGIHVCGNGTMAQTPQNQGVLELKNGAVIENARFAVMTYGLDNNGNDDYNSTGGIIKASNTTFRNNRKAVTFWAYPVGASNTIPRNVSYFNKCDFIVNDSNIFESSSTQFESHVSLWGVNGVTFKGCSFQNLTTSGNNRYRAIYTVDAGYNIDQFCTTYDSYYCNCVSVPIRSSFSGFNKAVESNVTGSQVSVKIDRSDFSDNIIDISQNGISNIKLSRLDISVNNGNNGQGQIGIRLDNCTGYKVEGNEIYSDTNTISSTGILVKNAGTDENRIYRNTLHDLHTAISVDNSIYTPPVRNIPPTGLQFVCNEMYDNANDLVVGIRSYIRGAQGSLSEGADNYFSQLNNNYNFYMDNSVPSVDYYFSNYDTLHYPIRRTGNVIIYNNAVENKCESTLCSYTDSLGGGSVRSLQLSLDEYIEINEIYSEMLEYFEKRHYDTVILNYYDGIIDDEQLLAEALKYQDEMMTLTDMMAQISNQALYELKNADIVNLEEIKTWYETINTLNAKYSLAETYFQIGEFDKGYTTLENIPYKFALNETERMEYDNYLTFYALKCDVFNSGRNFAQLNNKEIASLINVAGASSGLSSTMAQGILCFFYGICIDDETNIKTPAYIQNEDIAINNDNENSVLSQTPSIVLFPNPGTDKLTIQSEFSSSNFQLIDMNGIVVVSETLQQGNNLIDIDNLPTGIYVYIVRINSELSNKGIITGKWIKK